MTPIQIQSIREQTVALLTQRFGLDEASLTPGVSFDSLELDSLALVEFSIALQEDFGVPVGEEDITAEHTVNDVAELVATKIQSQDPVG